MSNERPARLVRARARTAPTLAALAVTAALGCRGEGASPDLLEGVRGVPSSEWAPCEPARRLCAGYPTTIEFHTHEELFPFVEYDLGKTARVSRIEVHNRRDGGLQHRAVPLVVFASPDGETWQQVARKDGAFDVWNVAFPPREARYLKLMVDRTSVLHLERVRAWE